MADIHHLHRPTTVEVIAEKILNDLERCKRGHAEWIEGAYNLCIDLAELKGQFEGRNIEFGRACEAHGFGKDVLNHQTRAAAIEMGKQPDALRACLKATERRSLHVIHDKEFSRFTNVCKTTDDEKATFFDPDKPPINVDTSRKPGRKPGTKAAKPKKSEQLDKALEAYDRLEGDGKTVTRPALVREAGVSEGTAQKAMGIRNAVPPVDPLNPETASPSVKKQMESWKRSEAKRLRNVIEAEIRAEIEIEYAAVIKQLKEREKDAEETLALHKGVFTKAEYHAVVKCLHPDTTANAEQKAEAFRLFTSLKGALIKADEPKFRGPPLPSTIAELLARRKARK